MREEEGGKRIRINNLLEDTLGVGNVVVLSGFVGNQCMEGKVGW